MENGSLSCRFFTWEAWGTAVNIDVSFVVDVLTGTVMNVEDNRLHIRHYDGVESAIPREECYLITPAKFETDCQYILHCEERLVGQAVVARHEKDGMFYLGEE